MTTVSPKTVNNFVRTFLRSNSDKSGTELLELWNTRKTQTSLKKDLLDKMRDPNAPKRALTNYLHFCDEKRPEVAAKNPNKETKEHTKILGDMWKKLSDEEKKPYNDKAIAGRLEYEEQMKRYLAENDGAVKMVDKPKRKKKGEQSGIPTTGYQYFLAVHRSEITSTAPKVVMSELGKRWSALTDEEKSVYKILSKDQIPLDEGRERISAVNTVSVTPETPAPKKKVSKKEKVTEKGEKKKTKKSTRATDSGFHSFVEEQRVNYGDLSEEKLHKTLRSEWKKLSDEDKAVYTEAVQNPAHP